MPRAGRRRAAPFQSATRSSSNAFRAYTDAILMSMSRRPSALAAPSTAARQASGEVRSAWRTTDRRPAAAHEACSFLGFLARARVRQRDVGTAPRELFGDDQSDSLAAGNQRDLVLKIHVVRRSLCFACRSNDEPRTISEGDERQALAKTASSGTGGAGVGGVCVAADRLVLPRRRQSRGRAGWPRRSSAPRARDRRREPRAT